MREKPHSDPPLRRSVCTGYCCLPPHPGGFPRTNEYPKKEKSRYEGMFPPPSFDQTVYTSSSLWEQTEKPRTQDSIVVLI